MCVFVALGIQHAMRISHIVICGLPGPNIFFHFISLTTRCSANRVWGGGLNTKCVCRVLYIIIIIIIIIIVLHGLGRLTCSGINALPSFPGASTISFSSRFVVEGVFRQSGVVQSFKAVDPVLFVFESHVLYSRDL